MLKCAKMILIMKSQLPCSIYIYFYSYKYIWIVYFFFFLNNVTTIKLVLLQKSVKMCFLNLLFDKEKFYFLLNCSGAALWNVVYRTMNRIPRPPNPTLLLPSFVWPGTTSISSFQGEARGTRQIFLDGPSSTGLLL